MKRKVYKEYPTMVFTLWDELKNTSIVGFTTSRGDKGFISTSNYEDKLIALCYQNNDSVQLSPFSVYGRDTHDTIQSALSAVDKTSYRLVDVFLFTSHKELFLWLAE